MKIAKWIAFGITVLSGVIYLVGYCVPMDVSGLPLRESSSIGIIGSADGPTTFVMTKNAPLELALHATFVLSLFAWLFFRWKSKKSG